MLDTPDFSSLQFPKKTRRGDFPVGVSRVRMLWMSAQAHRVTRDYWQLFGYNWLFVGRALRLLHAPRSLEVSTWHAGSA